MRITEETCKIIDKELPWVLPLIWVRSGDFKVQRMDLDVLNLTPSGHKTTWGGSQHTDKIVLIGNDGQVIGDVGVRVTNDTWANFEWSWSWPFVKLVTHTKPFKECFEETVDSAIRRYAPESNNTRFILCVWGYCSSNSQIVVHKIPKLVSGLKEWLDLKAEEEAGKIRQALEIDSD